MIFVDLFKPITWLSDANNGIMGGITTALRTLFFWLDTFIYSLIINLYDFFEKLCSARLLDSTAMKAIADRIGLILGLIMFFSVIFSFIQMLIDPDKIADKEKGAFSIVKRILIVIVMFGCSNFAFQSLYKVQSLVIKENVISKLIMPYEVSNKEDFGKLLSSELMKSFYQIESFDDVVSMSPDSENKKVQCSGMTTAFHKQILENGDFDIGYTCLNEAVDVVVNPNVDSVAPYEDQVYIVNFNGIFSVIVGAIVAYMLFMYCFKVGMRMAQLAFLEIISPMAIVSYMAPKKDNMFAKWWKLYFATYVDVFVRIAVINFVVFLLMTVFKVDSTEQFIFWESLGNPESGGEKSFFMIVIILALLTFAKKAPDLIKELFPASASKLGFGLSMKDVVGLQKVVKTGSGILGGAIGGAAAGGLAGRPLGAIGGALKGGLSGFKGQGFGKTTTSAWKNQVGTNKKITAWRNAGGGPLPFGMWAAGFQQKVGIDTLYDRLEEQYKDAKEYSGAYNSAKKKADGEVDKFASNYYFKDASGTSYSLLELDKMRNDDVHYSASERAMFDDVYNKIHGFARDQAMDKNGAIKNGSIVWADTGTGDWKDIEQNRTDNYDEKVDISKNSEIESNMRYILSSTEGKKATGTSNIEKAKAANDIYEDKVNNKVNDDTYKVAKADHEASKK